MEKLDNTENDQIMRTQRCIQLRNVILLGFGFFLLFSAWATTSMLAKLVTSSLIREASIAEFEKLNQTSLAHPVSLLELEAKNGGKYGDGFLSNGVLYATYAPTNFVAPAVIQLFQHKYTLV